MEYSQSALVKAIKEKDVSAYSYMIEKYTKTIYCLAYHILSPSMGKEDIEECVADVFYDAWVKIGQFDEERGSFRTWLLTLTKYKALTYRRKKPFLNSIALEDVKDEASYSIENQFLLRQDQEKVIEIINSFNPVDKELFFRRYFFGEKISDLAKSFNLSRSAIDNRLLRGRKIIKEALGYE
ncbi:sigma-70 family RNA polymerase sigma factor [Defluviitalea raffinosedens]|uniref:Sigma-70 family RNA polymerase sigma factor n=1 Tax=Defluviitalea raffinosedens TaxID=1450156 RepID=A0A7C8HD49_9FIRM|nr:sigma-70 family RNA polymerase sigma factor [Defluviitalea raffinosedens]MBM7686699.1 RNA polymerase sigma-70 factor (ECF subfamily) [Defluviitalea raffinosedens]HHW66442.1 sigma-70 family RNA polymerase sigma factor [Candidatus Epulonipiscium sp.]